jgi:hypothetical protein
VRRSLIVLATALAFFTSGLCLRAQDSAPAKTNSLDSSDKTPEPQRCKLLPYTGTIPLNQVQTYAAGEEDLRGGMTCVFRINPNLPLHTFHFAGEEDNTLGNLEISEGTSGKITQTIENQTDAGAIAPAPAAAVLAVVDANFDGYGDLQILDNCGATGNCSYNFYLYDPMTKQFVYNDFLSKLGTPSFDSAKKQVTTSWNMSAGDWQNETYQYQEGRYTLIHRETSEWDRKSDVITVKTYELRNGKMELVDSKTE